MSLFGRLSAAGRHAAKTRFRGQPYWEDPKVKVWEVTGCFLASGLMFYQVQADRHNHHNVFVANRDEDKEYMDTKRCFYFLIPSMSHLIKNAIKDEEKTEDVERKLSADVPEVIELHEELWTQDVGRMFRYMWRDGR